MQGDPGDPDRHGLALSVLSALCSATLLLSKALGHAWLGPAGTGTPSLVADWPAALSTLCAAAAALAAAGGGTSSCRQLAEQVWAQCGELMGGYTASCLLAPAPASGAAGGGGSGQQRSSQPLHAWLAAVPQQLSGPSGAAAGLAASAAAAVLAEACLAACHSCLRAAASAAVPAEGGGGGAGGRQLSAAGGAASLMACGPAAAAPLLAAGEGFSGGWRQALTERMAGQAAEIDSSLLASIASQLQPALVGLALGPGGSGGSGGRSGVAAAADQGWLRQEARGRAYGGLAHVLRMLCMSHPAADALHQQEHQRQQGSSGASAAAAMGQLLQGAARALLAAAPGAADARAGQPSMLSMLSFVGACCELSHHMKPAPSPAHFASLLALLLCALRALRCSAPAGAALDPVRRTIPFSALFPAASVSGFAEGQPSGGEAAAAAAAGVSGESAALARRAALDALRALLDGCTTQQLSTALRYAERALPTVHGSDALPVAELTLMALEASTGGRAGRVLSQHGDRLAGALTAFLASSPPGGAAGTAAAAVTGQAGAPGFRAQAATGQAEVAAAAAAGTEGGGLAELREVALAVQAAAGPVAAAEASTVAGAAGAALPVPPGPEQRGDADVAAACTALRALESLAARPQLFALSGRLVGNMLHAVAALWSARTALPAGAAAASAAGGARSVLSVSEGAALFTASCALLLAILRHRQEVRLHFFSRLSETFCE